MKTRALLIIIVLLLCGITFAKTKEDKLAQTQLCYKEGGITPGDEVTPEEPAQIRLCFKSFDSLDFGSSFKSVQVKYPDGEVIEAGNDYTYMIKDKVFNKDATIQHWFNADKQLIGTIITAHLSPVKEYSEYFSKFENAITKEYGQVERVRIKPTETENTGVDLASGKIFWKTFYADGYGNEIIINTMRGNDMVTIQVAYYSKEFGAAK